MSDNVNGTYREACLKYSNCIVCPKTAMCPTYQKYQKKLDPNKSIFEHQVSNPADFIQPSKSQKLF